MDTDTFLQRESQDCLVNVVRRIVLEQLHGQRMGSCWSVWTGLGLVFMDTVTVSFSKFVHCTVAHTYTVAHFICKNPEDIVCKCGIL